MSALEVDVATANRVLLRKLAFVAVLMFGFGFALVPFYEKICQVTGIRNLLQPDEVSVANTQVDRTRIVSIEFDANAQRLAWTFKPLEGHREVHPGEVTQVVYEIRNTLDRPVIVAYLLVIVAIFILINLAVDILYSVLDPRVRMGESKG